MENDGGDSVAVLSERIAHLDDKLKDLAVSLEKTNTALERTRAAMSALGRPDWKMWLGAASVISGAVWGLWMITIQPISDRIGEIERTYVPEKVHLERWKELDRKFQRIDEEFRRVTVELDKKDNDDECMAKCAEKAVEMLHKYEIKK
jgi:hypothetical protein